MTPVSLYMAPFRLTVVESRRPEYPPVECSHEACIRHTPHHTILHHDNKHFFDSRSPTANDTGIVDVRPLLLGTVHSVPRDCTAALRPILSTRQARHPGSRHRNCHSIPAMSSARGKEQQGKIRLRTMRYEKVMSCTHRQ